MTTIVSVRRGDSVALGGDGQVTLGNIVVKGTARKVRRLGGNKVLAGFAGGTADAFTLFDRFEAVGFERIAGGDQIDDGVAQADQRRQFHRAVQLDDVHMHAFGGEMLGSDVGVFCRDAQAAAGLRGGGVVETLADGDHHAAFGNLQIQRLIQSAAAVFD